MSVIRELQEQLQGTQTAAFVTTMLRDISATKLQNVREEFEANRAYFEELHAMTALVTGYAYERRYITCCHQTAAALHCTNR